MKFTFTVYRDCHRRGVNETSVADPGSPRRTWGSRTLRLLSLQTFLVGRVEGSRDQTLVPTRPWCLSFTSRPCGTSRERWGVHGVLLPPSRDRFHSNLQTPSSTKKTVVSVPRSPLPGSSLSVVSRAKRCLGVLSGWWVGTRTAELPDSLSV